MQLLSFMKKPKQKYNISKWKLPHDDAKSFFADLFDIIKSPDKINMLIPILDNLSYDDDLNKEESNDAMDHLDHELSEFYYEVDHEEDFYGDGSADEIGWVLIEPGQSAYDWHLGEYDEYEGNLVDEDDDKIDDESSEIIELITRASNAIESNNVDEILEVLEELNEYEKIDLNIAEIENWANLLYNGSLSDLNDTEEITNEQKLVLKVVKEMAVKLCEIIAEGKNSLNFIEWRQLEQVIAIALSGIGFEVILTPPSKDGGKDIVVSGFINGKRTQYFIEIKHWRSKKKVTSNLVYNFLEVNLNEKTDGGLFISSSGFSKNIFTHLSELCKQKIRLGTKHKIITLCQHFIRVRDGLWHTEQILPEILFKNTLK